MKKLKKILSILVAAMMILVLSTPITATNLTINEPEDSMNATYSGYKILDAADLGSNKFAYKLNSKYTTVLQEVTGKTDENDILKYISELNAENMRIFTNAVYKKIVDKNITADRSDLKTGSNDVDEGYWLIAQTSNAESGETGSLTMVNTIGKDSVEITAKKDNVTIDKDVWTGGLICDKDHTHTKDCYEYADDNTASIGDLVSFRLVGKIPSTASGFDHYYYVISDKLSKGLTFEKEKANIVVTVGGTTLTENTDYTVRVATSDQDAYTFQIALKDPKKYAGQEVVVTYDAILNLDAVFGSTGNPNEAKVDYSNNPNESYDDLDSNSDGFPDSDKAWPKGETPKAITVTYTTQIDILKIDGENQKVLTGAKFSISGDKLKVVKVNSVVYEKDDQGAYYMLKDGTYTDQEPQTEDKFVEKTDNRESGYVQDDNAEDNFILWNNHKYVEATQEQLADGSITLYTLVKANVDLYDSTEQKYSKVTKVDYETTTENFVAEGYTDKNGYLVFTGLGAGTYTITEIIAPSGYNLITEPIEITIGCDLPEDIYTGKEKCDWTYKVDGTAVDSLADGTLLLTVENLSGIKLPETGGIGTTIFYVVGSILLIGGAVILITRKRMHSED